MTRRARRSLVELNLATKGVARVRLSRQNERAAEDPTPMQETPLMTVEVDVAVEDEQRFIDAVAQMTEGTQVDLVAVRTEGTPTGWPQVMLAGPRAEVLEVLVRGGYDDHPSTYEVES